MSLLDPQPTKPSFLERFTLQTLGLTFAVSAGLSLVANIVWMFVGFGVFTAKEGEADWYMPIAGLLAVLLVLCIGGTVVTLVAALIRRFQGD